MYYIKTYYDLIEKLTFDEAFEDMLTEVAVMQK